MQDLRYDISQLLDAAFGVKSPIYITTPIRIGAPPPPPKFTGIEMKLEEFVETRTSWMGTPIVMPLAFLGGKNIKSFDDKGEIIAASYDRFDLPGATLIDFAREKKIIETQLSTGYGTVKELYAFGDWDIRIRGLCLNEPGVRSAQAQKKALLEFERVAESIRVAGQVFDDTLVFNIVIKRLVLREVEGQPNTIPYELECVSDEPIELTL